jgi:hypothetical protein
MYYVVVDIGCIECGESSAVIGIFTDKETAEKVAEDHEKRQKEHWTGQHYFEIFEIEKIDEIYEVQYG